MDSLTRDELRIAFAVALERFKEEIDKGRSVDFALTAATCSVLPKIMEALEAHERRRSVTVKPGVDFRAEAFTAASRLVALLRTGTSYSDAVADYWKRLNAAVRPIELF